MKHAIVAVAVAVTGGGVATAAAQDAPRPAGRIPVVRADDLPRHTYPVTTVTALLQEAAPFRALAGKLEADLRADFAKYEIRDRATLKSYYTTLGRLALLRGADPAALAYQDSVRSAEDKPALKLVGGLLERSLITARRGAPERLADRFPAVLRREVSSLPYAAVQAELRALKGNYELASPDLARGYLETMVGPAAQSGEISRELAQLVVEIRTSQDLLFPLRDTIVAILRATIAAHTEKKADIWAARDVALTARDSLYPVVVGVWDSGVDVSLYGAQLYRNPAEIPGNGRDDDDNGFVDDVHGFAFTLDAEKATGMLFPHGFDPAQEAEYRGYSKGFADLRAGLDTEAAQVFRQKAAGLPPDRLKDFFQGVREYGFYAHGTHVAGIAAKGNPAIRLLVARFSSDEFLSPASPPTPGRSRRWVGEVTATVDYFKRSGVRVVNMSWGYGPGYLESLLEDNNIGANAEERRALARRSFDIEVAGLRAAIAAAPGILFVASAGNEDEDNRFGEFIPSSLDLPNLLTVGAVDIAGDEADFTSYGAVHVYANGYEVPSFVPGGDVQRQSGTSMAAPQVVNLAAKMLAVKPDLSVAALKQAIVEGGELKTIGEGKQIRLLNPRASLERVRGRR